MLKMSMWVMKYGRLADAAVEVVNADLVVLRSGKDFGA